MYGRPYKILDPLPLLFLKIQLYLRIQLYLKIQLCAHVVENLAVPLAAPLAVPLVASLAASLLNPRNAYAHRVGEVFNK